MSAALFAESEPLASSAGQPASMPPSRSDPRTPARLVNCRGRVSGGHRAGSTVMLPALGNPCSPPAARRAHTLPMEQRALAALPSARGLLQHVAVRDIIANTAPTMGPVSTAPLAPSKAHSPLLSSSHRPSVPGHRSSGAGGSTLDCKAPCFWMGMSGSWVAGAGTGLQPLHTSLCKGSLSLLGTFLLPTGMG